MHTLTFRITNLNCDACVKMTTTTLRRLAADVTEATVDLETGNARIVSDRPIKPEDVTAALAAKGYTTAF